MADQEVDENPRWYEAEAYKVQVLHYFGDLPGVARRFKADTVTAVWNGQQTGFRIKGPDADIENTRKELLKLTALVKVEHLKLGHPPEVDDYDWESLANAYECIVAKKDLAVNPNGNITMLTIHGFDQHAVGFFTAAVKDVDKKIQIIPF